MKTNHFEESQEIERKNIITLFNQYLILNNCSNLILTSTDNYNSFDALCISALTSTVLIEYKRRNINLYQYSDCLIEYPKWSVLRKYHSTGLKVLYIIEYNDFIACWNLSTIFDNENYPNNPTHFFYLKDCTSTCDPDKYLHGEKQKLVRGLDFKNCDFFLDNNYQRMTYEQVNEYYVKSN